MKRFLIFAAFILSSVSVHAQYVDACITANSTLQSGPSPKSLWICRGTPVVLSGGNCISSFPPGYNAAYLSYSWQYLKAPSTIVNLTPNSQTKTVLDSGKYIVTVRYVDIANGINVLDKDTLHIKFYGTSIKIVQKNVAGIAIKCASDSLLLTTTILPGAAAGTVSQYNWYVVGNSTSLSNTDKVKVKNVNYYAVTAYESTYGCWIKDTVLLSNYPNPLVSLGPDKSICSGNSVTLSSTPLKPGVTLNLYTWYQNGAVVATGVPPTVTDPGPPSSTYTPVPSYIASTPGQYVVYVKAQGTGCSNSDTIVVDARPGADFSLTDSSICYTDSLQIIPLEISVVPPATYSWAPSSDLSATNIKAPYAKPTTAGNFTYSLTVTDVNNCPVTKSVIITKFPELVSSSLFADSTICTDSSITLIGNNATGGVPFVSGNAYLYSWKNSSNVVIASTQNGVVNVNLTTETFRFIVEDSEGCMDSTLVTVNTTEPIADLGPDQFPTGGQPVTLDPQSGNTVTFDWYTTGNTTSLGTTPTLSVTLTGEYLVWVEDILYGCRVSDTVLITFTEGNPELIYIPSAFSPSASDANDQVVKIYGEGLTADGFEFNIYNRWGDLVYSTTNLVEAKNTGWKGVSDNQDENQQNVFTYSVKGKYITGKSFEQTGTITLLR